MTTSTFGRAKAAIARPRANSIRRHLLLIALIGFLFHSAFIPTKAQGLTGIIKGTVSGTAADTAAGSQLVAGATLTLVNSSVTTAKFTTVSDDTGNFLFSDLPAGQYKLTVEAKGFPVIEKQIDLTSGATIVVEVTLTIAVSESVTVRDEEGLASTGETTTSNIVRAEKMEQLPLRADNAQGALPLTPSVVRDNEGKDHIKGTGAGQSSYTVNGADVTDPVSGNLAFDIPLEAAASIHVDENPYSADLGRASGGASNLETKSGGDKFKFGAARVFPVFHKIIGGKVDSFRPRVTFQGPLIPKRLNFLQSFEYRFSRIYVPSQLAPRDNSTSEAFNSFTQLDLTVNNSNRLKFVAALFPQKDRYVGLNTFNSQETTPNLKQRGTLYSISEQSIFSDQSFLTSLLAYKTFSFGVSGSGARPLILLPDRNEGSYFANTNRTAGRWQWQEQYFARTLSLFGQHALKFGAEVDHTNVSGRFQFQPIEIRRSDRTLSQRIEFSGPTFIDRRLTELGAFIQDRWVVSKSFTIDGGVRFDRNTIASRTDVSPRISILYLPFKDNRVVVRSGMGIFYDHSLLSTRYFEQADLTSDDDFAENSVLNDTFHTSFPERTVTTYASDGQTVLRGPLTYMNVMRRSLRDPLSIRWSVQVDRQLTRHLTLRGGYVHRTTTNQPIVIPKLLRNPGEGLLVLKSRGRSQYNEFEVLGLYNSPRFHNWTISYVWSKAQGSLNTADNFLGNFPAPVVRANQYGTLPFDVRHRFLAYGEIKAPKGITVMPTLEIRSGFPYSIVDDRLDFVGTRNSARFPTFFSFDATILKSITLPFLDKKARVGAVIFNITNHFNPRDVQNNLASSHFGQFYNSLGTSVRGKFELDF